MSEYVSVEAYPQLNELLDIIACLRPEPYPGERVFGVRWAFSPILTTHSGFPNRPSFPDKGFLVSRHGPSGDVILNNGQPYELPRSDSWTNFEADATSLAPSHGPWFDSIDEDELEFVLPLLRLVDPRTDTALIDDAILEFADLVGHTHEAMEELLIAGSYGDDIPELSDLLVGSHKDLVIDHYTRNAMGFLLALAQRFEFAALLGLGTDDIEDKREIVTYRVRARWGDLDGVKQSNVTETNRICNPPAPDDFEAERIPGSVTHPVFGEWTPVTDALGIPDNPPRVPSYFTQLTWAQSVPPQKLLDHQPVLFQLTRYHHEGSNPIEDIPPPPGANAFVPLREDENEYYQLAEDGAFVLDMPGMDWPALEGWYRYRIRGVDLLGEVSTDFSEVVIAHKDDIAPTIPGARLINQYRVSLLEDETSIDINLKIDWGADRDFVSPDAATFRVTASWTVRVAVSVVVSEVMQEEDSTASIVTLESLPGPQERYQGMRLTTASGTFLISAAIAGSPGTLQVRPSGDTFPLAGETGLIITPEDPTPPVRIHQLSRSPSWAAAINAVATTTPIAFTTTEDAPDSLTSAEVYVRALDASFPATLWSDGIWRIVETELGESAEEILEEWRSLPTAAATIEGSPLIFYPPHELLLSVSLPDDFESGVLELNVTAADGTTYQPSPEYPGSPPEFTELIGNESDPATVLLSVSRSLSPLAPLVPEGFKWATEAAVYAEHATFQVEWEPAEGTVRTEIWRVLEESILPSGVAPLTLNDQDLRVLAANTPQAFLLRSDSVFGSKYRDEIPGRAPTRAFYKVRAVGQSGDPGMFSQLIGPVRVPDIRQPPKPDLLPVRVPSRAIAIDPIEEVTLGVHTYPEVHPKAPVAGEPRHVKLQWYQPSDLPDYDFEIQQREAIDGSEWVTIEGDWIDLEGRRFGTTIPNLTPGKPMEWRIRCQNVVLDPIDPDGVQTRKISGPWSQVREGSAVGTAAAPQLLAVQPGVDTFTLSWQNHDVYEFIDIGVKEPGRFRHHWHPEVDGASQTAILEVVPKPGVWSFQLRARGYSRTVLGEPLEEKIL